MSAAARFLARLEPIAYDDDGTLENLATAFMAPIEIGEVARDTDTLVAWESLFDPDECPTELLDWLAIYNGVVLPALALTAAEKRYRIKQAAGRYRGTPRATAEEIQLVLTGTKTVLFSYRIDGDQWRYAIATIDAETPDEAAVERAVIAQKPAGMLVTRLLTSDWSWMVLAPTLVAERDDDDNYTLGTPAYPTWQSVLDAFSDWQHLLDNDPDL
jgi:hypothetical protein